jgi:uncharacterized protein (TIGR03000 family)
MMNTTMPGRTYQSFYPVERVGEMGPPVTLQVKVSANAEILFDGRKTRQTGAVREFVSPPIPAQGTFTYTITARWMENGQPVEQTRTVNVKAGQRVTVDFTTQG